MPSAAGPRWLEMNLATPAQSLDDVLRTTAGKEKDHGTLGFGSLAGTRFPFAGDRAR